MRTSPVDQSAALAAGRLSELRNNWWFPDHLVIAPLWRDLKEASRHAKGRLLDLGCGNAPYRSWFEDRTTRYVTADFPPLAAGVALACDSSFLPFSRDCFDTVLCTQMLEHTPTPWLVSHELYRVIRPDGVLILSCPQDRPAHEEPHDYFRFTVYGLRALFPQGRWEWLEHRQQGSTWAVIGCALWQSLSSFGRLARLAAFFLNPLFTLLDAFRRCRKDTTNHVVVLRKRPDSKEEDGSRGASDACVTWILKAEVGTLANLSRSTRIVKVMLIHNEATYFAGAEKMLGYYLDGLRGAPCEFAVTFVGGARVLEVIPDWVRRVEIPAKQRFSLGQLGRQTWSVLRSRKDFPFDLVHAWTARDWELASVVGLISRKPVVGTLHDHPRARFISLRRRRLMGWCARWGLRRVVCVSDAVRSACVAADYPGAKLSVIHNGLPQGGFPPTARAGVRNRIGFLGTFSERKGLRGLFAVLDHLSRCCRQPWEVHLAGGAQDADGEKLVAALTAQYKRSEWWPRIRWVGWVRRPADFLASVDVLLMPSAEFDPFPTVLLEAGMSGVPVVASRVGGVEEIVKDGDTGLLFEAGEWEQAALLVGRLLVDSGYARAIGQGAVERVSREFTVAKMVANHLQLYSTLSP